MALKAPPTTIKIGINNSTKRRVSARRFFSFPITKNYTALDKESNFFKKTAQMGISWDMMCMNMYIYPLDKLF